MSQALPLSAEPSPASRRSNAWKWWLTLVLFAAAVLTYLDRQTMSLCEAEICGEFHLNNEQFGQLLAAFRGAYAISHLPAGLMADRVPMRLTYALAVGLWSAAGAAVAWARGFRPLLAMRAMLGVGEGFNWPCATRILANVFPVNDRGLASGIFNSGASVGSLIAPFIISTLAARFGWRTAFFAIGSLGFGWVLLWLATTKLHPDCLAAVNAGAKRSLAYRVRFAAGFLVIGTGLPLMAIYNGAEFWTHSRAWWAGVSAAAPLLQTWLAWLLPLILAGVVAWSLAVNGVKSIGFWMLAVVAVTINPCYYFLSDWIPKYMHDQRGLSAYSAGMVTVPIFVGGGLGGIVSGGIIKLLTARGWPLRAARGATLAVCSLLVGPVALVTQCDNVVAVIALLGLAALGITSIVANYNACQQDLSFAKVGAVAGVLGLASNVVSTVLNPLIGRHVDQTRSYTLIFVLLAVLPVASVAAVVVFDAVVHRGRTDTTGSPKA